MDSSIQQRVMADKRQADSELTHNWNSTHLIFKKSWTLNIKCNVEFKYDLKKYIFFNITVFGTKNEKYKNGNA